MAERISAELRLAEQLRGIAFEPWYDLLLDHLDQAGIDGLGDHEERLGIQGVDPVVGGGPQAQSLAAHVAARQRRLRAVVHAHVPIDVEHACGFGIGLHPLPTQRGAPLRGLALVGQHTQLLA